MAKRYVALLRAIAHVSMAPFREALEELGYTDVESFGMSGNLLFTGEGTIAGLEKRISARLDKVAIVRTAAEMAAAVRANPFPEADSSGVLFFARPPAAAKQAAFAALELTGERPVLRGKTLFFRWPVTIAGRKGPVDLEKHLGLGTMRSGKIARRIAERLAAGPARNNA